MNLKNWNSNILALNEKFDTIVLYLYETPHYKPFKRILPNQPVTSSWGQRSVSDLLKLRLVVSPGSFFLPWSFHRNFSTFPHVEVSDLPTESHEAKEDLVSKMKDFWQYEVSWVWDFAPAYFTFYYLPGFPDNVPFGVMFTSTNGTLFGTPCIQ